MKHVSFLLITSVIFCYTGIASHAHHSLISPGSGAYHVKQSECHKQKANESNTISSFYKSTDAPKHEMLRCCHYMLPNAPNSHDFSLVNTLLFLIAAHVPTLGSNEVSTSILNHKTKKKYEPPDLFLINSSFLI